MVAEINFPTPEAWLDHSVSYGETDAMGVVYYAEYLHYFERSRSLYIRERGISYSEVEKKGIYLPVREASCRYRIPAHYEDQLNIHVGISKWKRASVKFVYEIYKNDRSIHVASGFTEHACVNSEGRPVKVPSWLRDLF